MTISEAVKTGKPFRRRKDVQYYKHLKEGWFCQDFGAVIKTTENRGSGSSRLQLSYEDIISDDWITLD